MRADRLNEAIIEAKRFLAAAEAVEFGKGPYPLNPKQSARARRASLDLTRALAILRKGDFV